MIRDFTEATKQELFDLIDNINEQNEVADFFCDGGLWIKCGAQTLFGLDGIDEDMSNVVQYQREYLDRHDTTQSEITTIFENVRNEDLQFSSQIAEINSLFNTYNNKLITMASALANGFSSVDDLDNLISVLCEQNGEFNATAQTVLANFNSEMDWKTAKEMDEARYKVVLSSIGIITNVAEIVADVATGNVVFVVNDAYQCFNDIITLTTNCMALDELHQANMSEDCMERYQHMMNGSSYSGREGIAGLCEASIEINGPDKYPADRYLLNVVRVVDFASDTISIYKDANEFVGNVQSFVDSPSTYDWIGADDYVDVINNGRVVDTIYFPMAGDFSEIENIDAAVNYTRYARFVHLNNVENVERVIKIEHALNEGDGMSVVGEFCPAVSIVQDFSETVDDNLIPTIDTVMTAVDSSSRADNTTVEQQVPDNFTDINEGFYGPLPNDNYYLSRR